MLPNSLYQQDIFWRLKYGVSSERLTHMDVFEQVIGSELERICASFGCSPDTSSIALLKAQKAWVSDIEELPITGGSDPDHLKHSGWLCHWLRKKQPIKSLEIHDATKLLPWFEEAYNEVCAFIVGLRLAVFHECCLYNYSDNKIIQATKLASYSELLPDVALYLDHKNVSPHAIYLIYKASVLESPLDRAR